MRPCRTRTWPLDVGSTVVTHMVSRTSSTADANAFRISFGSMRDSQSVFHLFPQGFWREGFGDVSLRPQREHLVDAALGPVGGDHQDGNQTQHLMSGHPPQKLLAVHFGHVDVG